jgi:hypothetical protein
MLASEVILNGLSAFHQIVVNLVPKLFFLLELSFLVCFDASIVLLPQVRNFFLHALEMTAFLEVDSAHLPVVELSSLLVLFFQFIYLLCFPGLVAIKLQSNKKYFPDVQGVTHLDLLEP